MEVIRKTEMEIDELMGGWARCGSEYTMIYGTIDRPDKKTLVAQQKLSDECVMLVIDCA